MGPGRPRSDRVARSVPQNWGPLAAAPDWRRPRPEVVPSVDAARLSCRPPLGYPGFWGVLLANGAAMDATDGTSTRTRGIDYFGTPEGEVSGWRQDRRSKNTAPVPGVHFPDARSDIGFRESPSLRGKLPGMRDSRAPVCRRLSHHNDST